MKYWKQLKDPRWQKLRLQIMQRDNFVCFICCDSTSPLNVHHLEYDDAAEGAWDYMPDKLVTLCEHCHAYYHSLDQKGEFLVRALIIRFFAMFYVMRNNDIKREKAKTMNETESPQPEPSPEPPPPPSAE
jgi:hypothetical protein